MSVTGASAGSTSAGVTTAGEAVMIVVDVAVEDVVRLFSVVEAAGGGESVRVGCSVGEE
jgi:hypothetical protein